MSRQLSCARSLSKAGKTKLSCSRLKKFGLNSLRHCSQEAVPEAKQFHLNITNETPQGPIEYHLHSKREFGGFFSEENLTWEDLKVDPKLIQALLDADFLKPSHIQEISIPTILSGEDVVIAAETGTGKTVSYLLPIIQLMLEQSTRDKDKPDLYPRTIILQPNRHLCMQVEAICNLLLKNTNLSCYSMAGLQWLPRDPSMVPDILITTPNCFAENFKRTVNQNRHRNFLTRIQWVVMDEADMLLVGSYKRAMKDFLYGRARLEEKWQRGTRGVQEMSSLQYVFCAATLPTQAKSGPARILRPIWQNAEWVSTPGLHRALNQIEQQFKLVVPGEQLLETERFLEFIGANGEPDDETKGGRPEPRGRGEKNKPKGPQRIIMFVNKPEHAWALSRYLREKGFLSYSVTSRMDKVKAYEIITRFQEGGINFLIGTDLISRGLDFKNVDWVINVDFPENVLFYLHRAGRTGRAGEGGKVMSFYTIYEADLANAIQTAAEGKGSYQYCFSRKRSFRRRLINSEERGTNQRMSAPKLHELRFDVRRVDQHFRDGKVMERYLTKLEKDEEQLSEYMEEVYDRPFDEIRALRNKYDSYKHPGQTSDAEYFKGSLVEAQGDGASLDNSDYKEMTESEFDDLIKTFEQRPDSDSDGENEPKINKAKIPFNLGDEYKFDSDDEGFDEDEKMDVEGEGEEQHGKTVKVGGKKKKGGDNTPWREEDEDAESGATPEENFDFEEPDYLYKQWKDEKVVKTRRKRMKKSRMR